MKYFRERLINAGVKPLKQYGYPECNADNILTDTIYKEFFKSILKDNLGVQESTDVAIKSLLKEIQ